MNVDKKQKARFLAKLDKSGDRWMWTGYVMPAPDGYGMFRVGGRMQVSHRVSWTIHNGAIPDGMSVLHRCDNAPCVNPRHLFVGTQKDNMRDCAKKGRTWPQRNPGLVKRGEGHGAAKLSAADVRKTRKTYGSGQSQAKFGELFGITQTAISSIVRRKSWKHI